MGNINFTTLSREIPNESCLHQTQSASFVRNLPIKLAETNLIQNMMDTGFIWTPPPPMLFNVIEVEDVIQVVSGRD